MKTVLFATLSGAMLALAVAGAACQSSSSSSPDTSGTGTSGAGGDSSTGGTGAGATGGTGAGAMGGTGAGAMGGTGVGAMGGSVTAGAAGTGTAGTGTAGTGAAGNGTGGATSTGGTSSAGGKCSTVGTLHPPDPDAGAATLYCPFAGPMGMGAAHCIPGMEHCCESPAMDPIPSACVPIAMPCGAAKATDWACEDPTDCGSGKQCCGNGTIVLGTPGCGNFASKMTGTTCKTKCDVADITMCTSDAQCGAGKTCIPFSKSGNQVGGCSQ